MHPVFRRRSFVLATLALGLASLPDAGATERSGAAALDPADPAAPVRAVRLTATATRRATAPMKVRVVPAADPAKREVFVDDGLDAPAAGLTDAERVKLEAARAAVEASRAAGTLHSAAARTPRLFAPLHEIEAAKLDRLRRAVPAPAGDPEAMGLPARAASRQKTGSAALSAKEKAKLESRPATVVTPEVEKEGSR